jgi:hypothetical protein
MWASRAILLILLMAIPGSVFGSMNQVGQGPEFWFEPSRIRHFALFDSPHSAGDEDDLGRIERGADGITWGLPYSAGLYSGVHGPQFSGLQGIELTVPIFIFVSFAIRSEAAFGPEYMGFFADAGVRFTIPVWVDNAPDTRYATGFMLTAELAFRAGRLLDERYAEEEPGAPRWTNQLGGIARWGAEYGALLRGFVDISVSYMAADGGRWQARGPVEVGLQVGLRFYFFP